MTPVAAESVEVPGGRRYRTWAVPKGPAPHNAEPGLFSFWRSTAFGQPLASADCAAASRAIGTRNGEQDT